MEMEGNCECKIDLGKVAKRKRIDVYSNGCTFRSAATTVTNFSHCVSAAEPVRLLVCLL